MDHLFPQCRVVNVVVLPARQKVLKLTFHDLNAAFADVAQNVLDCDLVFFAHIQKRVEYVLGWHEVKPKQ